MNTLSEVKGYCDKVGKALSQEIDINNHNEVLGKINELTALLALSSHAVAVSEMIYNAKLGSLIESKVYASNTPTEKKLLYNAKCKDEIYFMTLSAEQNKALKYRSEGLRTVASYLKTEMENIQR